MPRIWIPGSYFGFLDHHSIVNFWRNFHTVLHSGYTNLHLHQQEGSLFSTSSSVFINLLTFGDGHSDWCGVVPHCSFDLYFEESGLSDNKELELIGHNCKLGMTESRWPGQGPVPAWPAGWWWFCPGNAKGTLRSGPGDELCLMPVGIWGSRIDELTAEKSGLEKPRGAVGDSWHVAQNAASRRHSSFLCRLT